MAFKRWEFLKLNKEAAGMLSEECGLDPVLCLLLTGRGITDADAAMDFLVEDALCTDPYLFADMDAAAERVQQALDCGESIAVYGDYDADGVTATALLYSYLKSKGACVSYLLPRRDGDGYGLHRNAVDTMKKQGVQLIITVDNGVSAAEEVAYANACGMEVVITDHHQPPDILPEAVAVVDPHRRDCPSACKDFAGVGMAFFLVCALEGDSDWALDTYADLVALGTLADVMPLCGDNRLLVRRGVRQMNAATRPGLQKLREVAGFACRPLTSSGVVFALAPRLNAAGRMGDPDKAVELLLADTEENAAALAKEISDMNTARQETEAAIRRQVAVMLSGDMSRLSGRVLVICGEGWHPGVLGIIAARLTESYGKPCIVLSSENGIAHGSGRSVKGFSLYQALAACSGCLLTYGGHELAAGLTLETVRVDEFVAAVNAYAAVTCPTMPAVDLTLDCKLFPSQVTPELATCLSALEPFGAGNPAPLFGLCRMMLEKIDPVGGGKHLRLTLLRDGCRMTAMKFSTEMLSFPFVPGDMVNLAVTLDRNDYRGTPGVTVIVRDIRYADTDQEEMIRCVDSYEAVMRREMDTISCPDREKLAAVYRRLKRGAFTGSVETLLHSLPAGGMTATDLLLCLQLLSEAELIDWHNDGDSMTAAVREQAEKTDLTKTPTALYLRNGR